MRPSRSGNTVHHQASLRARSVHAAMAAAMVIGLGTLARRQRPRMTMAQPEGRSEARFPTSGTQTASTARSFGGATARPRARSLSRTSASPQGSAPVGLTQVGETLYFVAEDPERAWVLGGPTARPRARPPSSARARDWGRPSSSYRSGTDSLSRSGTGTGLGPVAKRWLREGHPPAGECQGMGARPFSMTRCSSARGRPARRRAVAQRWNGRRDRAAEGYPAGSHRLRRRRIRTPRVDRPGEYALLLRGRREARAGAVAQQRHGRGHEPREGHSPGHAGTDPQDLSVLGDACPSQPTMGSMDSSCGAAMARPTAPCW